MAGLVRRERLLGVKRLMAGEGILLAVCPFIVIHKLTHVASRVSAHKKLPVAEGVGGGLGVELTLLGVLIHCS